jgi:hypothetical protein
MQDPEKQKKMYKLLSVVFGIAGFLWIVAGIWGLTHFILFPLIGLVNLAIAWYCKQNA